LAKPLGNANYIASITSCAVHIPIDCVPLSIAVMSKIPSDAGSGEGMKTCGDADLAHPHEQDPSDEQEPVTLWGHEQTAVLAMLVQSAEPFATRRRLLIP
jgi:hypothetical protein